MKKALILLTVMLVCFSLSAQAGAGISVNGDNRARTGVELNFTYRPFELNVANPFVRAEGGIGFGRGGFGFSEFKAVAGVELFRTMSNPFAFTMINKGPWSPAVSAGIITGFDQADVLAELSLVRVLDKDFIYEWFTVFGVFDRSGLKNWGVCLFRLTSMF